MQHRDLGTTGIRVAPIVFGGNVFGWTADEKTSFALLDAFVDAGYNTIDTADVYSKWVPGHTGGESETIIGRWLASSGKREKVIVATKVGMEMAHGDKGLSRRRILRSAEASLSRLQTDYIDLYQSHADDLETSVAEPLEAYAQLIKEGKVRCIGASNFSPQRLRDALEISDAASLPRYQTLQPPYNLYDRNDFETNFQPLVEEQQLAVIPYFSLAAGFLTGKYRTAADVQGRARANKVQSYLNERGLRILGALDEVAAKHHSTPARVALAWLMSRPGVTAPIASATSVDQLHDLLGAGELQLEQGDIVDLDHASSDLASQAAVWALQN